MKLKKFLIIILSVALLSCFAVSTFATSATIPDYGFYISPGEYVYSQQLSDLTFDYVSYAPFFVGSTFSSASAYYFNDVVQFSIGETITVYENGSWIDDSYRYVTYDTGFYIYDINFYQWWQSNVTRVDSGYDDNLLDGILSSFTFIGEWIAGAAIAVTPMFWDGEALTVVGTLSVAGLSFAVVFLLIALVSSFMKFRS